jgi:hypothetical protein
MKPWMKPSFDRYDDSEDDSESDSEAEFEYPKLLVDDEGRKRFILNKTEERKFNLMFSGPKARTPAGDQSDGGVQPKNSSTANNLSRRSSTRGNKAKTEVDLPKSVPTRKGRTHGIAPFGMTVPLPGKAYVMGKETGGKTPLMESSLETYNRMQTVKIRKAARDNKRYIQSLKRTGKVGTLAPYMFSI